MTPDNVRLQVAEVIAASHDPEAAHYQESLLHQAVLEAIAAGAVDLDTAREIAQLALTTRGVEFPRWYA